jgi:hypothetical protein
MRVHPRWRSVMLQKHRCLPTHSEQQSLDLSMLDIEHSTFTFMSDQSLQRSVCQRVSDEVSCGIYQEED